MKLVSAMRIGRFGLSLAIAFWIAGGGCLLVCETILAAATSETSAPSASSTVPDSSQSVVAGNACRSKHSHDCCSKHGGRRAATRVAVPSAMMHSQPESAGPVPLGVALAVDSTTTLDCPLAANAAAVLSKARPDTSDAASAQTHAADYLPPLRERTSAISQPLTVPNRGHTYLHCCVFLI